MSNPEITSSGDITNIGDKIRIEPCPKRVTEIATEELLSDTLTAAHYQVGGTDASGRPIVLGEPMTYLCWGGADAAPIIVQNVYQMTPIPEEELIDGGATERFVCVGSYDTRDEAISAGTAIAISLANGG